MLVSGRARALGMVAGAAGLGIAVYPWQGMKLRRIRGRKRARPAVAIHDTSAAN